MNCASATSAKAYAKIPGSKCASKTATEEAFRVK